MKKMYASILLMVYLGFSFFPNVLFLGMHILSDFKLEYQEEKLPCLKGESAPLTGDFAYLFAIQKRTQCENHHKKASTPPVNHFDTTNILYFLPSDIQGAIFHQAITTTNFYYGRIFQIHYPDISVPPPKGVNV
jgi:hypothetical protein